MMRWMLLAVMMFLASAVSQTDAGQPLRVADEIRWRDLPNTDTVFAPKTYRSLDQWKARRQWLIEQVKFAAGLIPEPERTKLEPQFAGKIVREDCTIEKVYFESLPGLYVTGNLYRPLHAEGKLPAIACPHGHWPKGRINHEERGSVPARCITFARLGAVVFSYDMLCYNDSGKQLKFKHREPALSSPANALWGIGQFQLQTWNSIRVIDFLQSLPDVDPKRMGVTGASGGGTQTFILSAVDDRVKVAAPVNMISSTMQGGCICENAPALRIDTENMEIGALFAPKPLMLISASGDWTKLTPKVEYPFIRSIYELYDAADHVANVHIDAEHNYNLASRQGVYPWFAKWLLGRDDADGIKEGEIKLDDPRELLIFNEDNPPAQTRTLDQLVAQLKRDVRKKIESIKPEFRPAGSDYATRSPKMAKIVRRGLRHAIGVDFPAPHEVNRREYRNDGYSALMAFIRARRFVPLVLHFSPMSLPDEAPLPVTIIVHPDGVKAAETLRSFVDRELDEGKDVVLVQPFGLGGNQPPTDAEPARGTTKFFTTFNRTDHAEAIYDILSVVGSFLHDRRRSEIRLVGFGEMGPLCLVARALVPPELANQKRLRTVIDLNGFDIRRDESYLQQLNLPNIQKLGGLEAVAVAAVNSPMWLHNAHASFRGQWALMTAGVNAAMLKLDRAEASLEAISAWLEMR